MTRSSSGQAVARRSGRGSAAVRAEKPFRRFWTSAGPRVTVSAERSRLKPRVGRAQVVHDLPVLVDGAVAGGPGPPEAAVGLGAPPPPAHRLAVPPRGELERRQEALHPAVDGAPVDRDPPLGQQLLHVAVAEAEPAGPPHRVADELPGRAVPFVEGRRVRHRGGLRHAPAAAPPRWCDHAHLRVGGADGHTASPGGR